MWREFDKAFFQFHRSKGYLARPYEPNDGPMPAGIVMFGIDETGATSPINMVIVKRIVGGRIRRLFAVASGVFPGSDSEIIVFLVVRGIDPLTMMPWSDNEE
jgi:hypothetical protein